MNFQPLSDEQVTIRLFALQTVLNGICSRIPEAKAAAVEEIERMQAIALNTAAPDSMREAIAKHALLIAGAARDQGTEQR